MSKVAAATPAPAKTAARGRAPAEAKAQGEQPASVNPVWELMAWRAQAKPTVSTPDDSAEREADRVAERITQATQPHVQRQCAACAAGGAPCPTCEENAQVLRAAEGAAGSARVPDGFAQALGAGRPLEPGVRAFFEPRFGQDFSGVRVHTDARADAAARSVDAVAFTLGRHIAFRAGRYLPQSDSGRKLLAHELTHTVQQSRAGSGREHSPAVQREIAPVAGATQPDPLTAPLTEREWQTLYLWLARGEVGIDPLTDDADHNADLVAAAIFCERMLFVPGFGEGEDPLLCVLDEVTTADPRVRRLKRHVTARGPIIHWPAVPTASRLLYVMDLLVGTYHYPVNGAAGIVGNLMAESGVLPSRIEGSTAATPMRAASFAGATTTFTPEEVMNRSAATGVGPRMPGIGLAQWTTPARRSGLFQRTSGGRQLGSSILFDMDAQVAYLVSELQANAGLNASLTAAGVTLNDASDDVVYRFEIPGSILDAAGHRLPRADPAVQAVFAARRANAQQALQAYQAAHQP